MKLGVMDLFSGIGGFALGLEETGGFETVAFCEIETFPVQVLNKHWPEVPVYRDVRELTAKKLAEDEVGEIDVICGGFPCQDISLAGRGEGIYGERSGLWSEYFRLIKEIKPRWVIIENVSALRSPRKKKGDRGFDPAGMLRILNDLSEIGYDAEWHCITASSVGAPHQRDRIWIVAYPSFQAGWSGLQKSRKKEWGSRFANSSGSAPVGNSNHPRLQGLGGALERARKWSPWSDGEIIRGADGKDRVCPPGVPLLAHGIPQGMERIKSTGNAVVPMIPYAIGQCILEWEMENAG